MTKPISAGTRLGDLTKFPQYGRGTHDDPIHARPDLGVRCQVAYMVDETDRILSQQAAPNVLERGTF